ncbi:MAG: hypothetical protein ACREQZ_02110 [Woeseiaceae bacterium]
MATILKLFGLILVACSLPGCSTADLEAVNRGMSQSMESNRDLMNEMHRARR